MGEESLVTSIVSIIALLLVAASSAIVLKRIRFPYTIGLVVVGIVLGALCSHFQALAPMRRMHLTPDVILYLIIPTLVFQAAVNIDSRLLMKNLSPVLVLAAPGLLLSTLIVGGLVTILTPLSVGPAMLFGALISATDPVAVIALFKEIGAPKRLTLLVDGESLFNDATAIVVFNIIFGIIAVGAWGTIVFLKGAMDFAVVFVGGVMVGAIIGYLMVRVISLAKNDPLIEVAFSTVVAYAAFIVANYYLKLSGVMAVVGAGIVVSWYGSTRFTPEVKQYLSKFWEFAAFVANSFIFLLLGFTEDFFIRDIIHGPGLLIFILAAIAAVTLARVAVIYGLTPLINRLPGAEPIDLRNQTVMFWGGLRGAVPLALALSLSADFEFRNLILELTLGVVLFTLLVQGTTVKRLIHLLKLDRATLLEKVTRLEAMLAAKREVLKRLSSSMTMDYLREHRVNRIMESYKRKESAAENALLKLRSKPAFPATAIPQMMWSQVITVEKQTYRSLFDRGIISESVLRELELSSDLQKDRLWQGEIPPRLMISKPIILRIQDYMLNIIERSIPQNRLVQHHLIRAVGARYEENIAVIEASTKVKNTLDDIAKLCGAEPSVKEECRRLYEIRYNNALKQLKITAEQFPKYMDAVSDRTLYRAALSTEFDTIQELASRGEIPEKTSLDLQKNIDRNLHAATQQRTRELENSLQEDVEQT